MPSSYCPYSNFSVHCLIQTMNGKTYEGVNIENSSYGLTSCAEANAIAAIVKDNIDMYTIKNIIIKTNSAEWITPCGACRQIINEHIPSHVPIICIGTKSKDKYRINDLLPNPFNLKARL